MFELLCIKIQIRLFSGYMTFDLVNILKHSACVTFSFLQISFANSLPDLLSLPFLFPQAELVGNLSKCKWKPKIFLRCKCYPFPDQFHHRCLSSEVYWYFLSSHFFLSDFFFAPFCGLLFYFVIVSICSRSLWDANPIVVHTPPRHCFCNPQAFHSVFMLFWKDWDLESVPWAELFDPNYSPFM